MAETGILAIAAVVICGVALVIAWILLPFALIGTKPLLRELIRETKRTNELLRRQTPPSN